MLPAVLAVFHCFRCTWYYIFFGLAAKGLSWPSRQLLSAYKLIQRIDIAQYKTCAFEPRSFGLTITLCIIYKRLTYQCQTDDSAFADENF